LATNAAKYGALKGDGGTLAVTWEREDTGRLVLDWRETTVTPISAPTGRRGFGSELLAKSIRGQLGGEITFDWAGDGLKCRLELPLQRGQGPVMAGEKTAAPEPAQRQAAAPRSNGKALPRILLAEDEPLVAMDLEARLQGFGYAVFAAVDSVAAAMSALDGDQPDAALLDANLHGESSVPVAAELHRRGVPTIFITGYDSIEGLPAALAGLPRLPKPIVDHTLRDTLATLLNAG
ncbi:MAG: response regulator, partial [Kiloniellaceae bacterium]